MKTNGQDIVKRKQKSKQSFKVIRLIIGQEMRKKFEREFSNFLK